MVIRVLAVPDYLDLASFDEVFRSLLGWDGLGFGFHIHGQEYTRRASRPAFSERRRRTAQPCGIFSCGRGRHFSTRAEGWIFGNGSSGFWTLKQEVEAMTRRCAWRVGAHLHQNTAAARRVIG